MAAKTEAFTFWKSTLRGARVIVAPMVDQSELAWRLLSRQYGAELCYTPMLHASVFRRDPVYRRQNFRTCPEDRPLIVQFCANDPETLLESARYVESHCDAVDINLGCPQTIAKKGHYGAFLQDDWDLIAEMVGLLHRELSVPVTCKIRVFEEIARTVDYAKMLEKAGCQLLTVHGRTRDQKGPLTGLASWDHIKAVKENVNIPVFANGNIQFLRDIEQCFLETGVDGIMSAEGNLYNPALFTGRQPPCWTMVEEYLKWVKIYPPPVSFVRGHLFKLCHHILQTPGYEKFRDKIGAAKTVEALEIISMELKSLVLSHLSKEELNAVYSIDNLPFWRCQPYIRPSVKRHRMLSEGTEDFDVQSRLSRKKAKKEQKRLQMSMRTASKKQQWIGCIVCRNNPKGLKCVNDLCKKCCKTKCSQDVLDCPSHHLLFKTKAISLYGCVENCPKSFTHYKSTQSSRYEHEDGQQPLSLDSSHDNDNIVSPSLDSVPTSHDLVLPSHDCPNIT